MVNIIVGWSKSYDPPLPWRVLNDYNGKYIKFTSAPGYATQQGGSDTHTHTLSITSIGLPSTGHASGYHSEVANYSHTHPLGTYSVGAASNAIPYFTFRLIYADLSTLESPANRFLPEGAIVFAESTIDCSELTRLSSADGYYAKAASTYANTGGSLAHTHSVTFNLGASTESAWGEYLTVYHLSSVAHKNHAHPNNVSVTSTSGNLSPRTLTTRWYLVNTNTNRLLAGIVCLFDGTPSSNWSILTGWNGGFLKSGGQNAAISEGSAHTHTASATSSANDLGESWRTKSGTGTAVSPHTHNVTLSLASASPEPPYVLLVPAKLNVTLVQQQTRSQTYNIGLYMKAVRSSDHQISTRLRVAQSTLHDMNTRMTLTFGQDHGLRTDVMVMRSTSHNLSTRFKTRRFVAHMAAVTLKSYATPYEFTTRLIRTAIEPPPVIDTLYRSFIEQLNWTYQQLQKLDVARDIDANVGSDLDEKWGRVYDIPRLTANSKGIATAYNFGPYRRKVVISSQNPHVDYEQKLELDLNDELNSGMVRQDLSDLQIVDEFGNVLPHYVESFTGGEAVVWVKIPFVDAGVTELHVYFGSPLVVNRSQPDEFSEFPDPLEYEVDDTEFMGYVHEEQIRDESTAYDETDDEYRVRMKTYMSAITGSGTIDACQKVVDTIVGEQGATEVTSRYPAIADVWFKDFDAMVRAKQLRWLVYDALSRALAAGVTPELHTPVTWYWYTTYLRGQNWRDFDMNAALVAEVSAQHSMWTMLVSRSAVGFDLSASLLAELRRSLYMNARLMASGSKAVQMSSRVRDTKSANADMSSRVMVMRDAAVQMIASVLRTCTAGTDLDTTLLATRARSLPFMLTLVRQPTVACSISAALFAFDVRQTYRFRASLMEVESTQIELSASVSNNWQMPVKIYGAGEDLYEWEQKIMIDFGERYFDAEKCTFVDANGDDLPWMIEAAQGGMYTFWVKLPVVPAGGIVKIYLRHGDAFVAEQSPEEFGEFPEPLEVELEPIEAIYV